MTALVRGGNIEEHICNLEERFAEQQKLLESLGLSIEAVKSELKSFPRHWHLVRYNAFDKTGSDLSFTLALLNDQMDGFVLTSIFGRETPGAQNPCSGNHNTPYPRGAAGYQGSHEK